MQEQTILQRDSNRAVRFDIRVPVLYRTRGAEVWLKGKSMNISRTGLLMRVGRVLEPGTGLDMVFTLPHKAGPGRGARVVCAGFVARTIEPAEELPPRIGVQISNFALATARDHAAQPPKSIRDLD